MASAYPTQFPDLNALLHDLVPQTENILGNNFVGAYLQGSFALGDADMQSDCDFLIVTRSSLTAAQEKSIRKLHDDIRTRPEHWAHHLEGSYAPQDELRSLSGLARNGSSSTMVTAAARWNGQRIAIRRSFAGCCGSTEQHSPVQAQETWSMKSTRMSCAPGCAKRPGTSCRGC
jgi:hypothetical protein